MPKPPKIVVEPSANHLGDIRNMLSLITAAKDVGADYIKFQCYEASSITINSDRDDFILKAGPWKGKKLWDLYDGAHTPREWFPELKFQCQQVGMPWFASVFCEADVDFMESIGCPMYKIASYEIVDLPLIKYATSTGKPLVISTGMASPDEVVDALEACSTNPVLLHCVSGYPTADKDSKLNAFIRLRYAYPFLSVGISDHSLGHNVAIAATALGADMVEKHLCLDRNLGGPDAHFSMEPDEFKAMVLAIKSIYHSLNDETSYAGSIPASQEDPEGYSRQQRRSLYAVKDIAEGEVLSKDNIRSIRPGFGLPPSKLPSLLGTKARRAYKAGEPLDLYGVY